MLISGFLSIFPLFPAWIVYLIAFVNLYFQGEIILAFVLLTFGISVNYMLDPWILSFIELPQTYLTGLSIVFGDYF